MAPADGRRALTVGGPAGRRAAIFVTTTAVVVLSLGVIWAVHHRGGGFAEGADPGDSIEVGVVSGQSVPAYLAASRDKLDELAGAAETWALVSLNGYEPPGQLPAQLDGAGVAQVYTRVPMATGQPQVLRIPVFRLPQDVTAGMSAAALQRDQERAEYLRLRDQVVGDDAEAERARAAYTSAADVAGAEADAYRSGCSCVFAAVIRAAPAGLRRIADRPGVRVVDPAPEVQSPADVDFRAPLPEQVGTVPDRPPSASTPVPTGSTGIASRAAAPLVSSLGPAVKSDSRHGSPSVTPSPSGTASEEHGAVTPAPGASAAQTVPSKSPTAASSR